LAIQYPQCKPVSNPQVRFASPLLSGFRVWCPGLFSKFSISCFSKTAPVSIENSIVFIVFAAELFFYFFLPSCCVSFFFLLLHPARLLLRLSPPAGFLTAVPPGYLVAHFYPPTRNPFLSLVGCVCFVPTFGRCIPFCHHTASQSPFTPRKSSPEWRLSTIPTSC